MWVSAWESVDVSWIAIVLFAIVLCAIVLFAIVLCAIVVYYCVVRYRGCYRGLLSWFAIVVYYRGSVGFRCVVLLRGCFFGCRARL